MTKEQATLRVRGMLKSARKNTMKVNAVPVFKPQFVYEDTGEPAANRYILYWVNDENGQPMAINKKSPNIKNVAVSKTDDQGYMEVSKGLIDLRLVDPDNAQNTRVTFKPSLPETRWPRPVYFMEENTSAYGDERTRAKFPPHRQVGFLSLGLDNPSLQSWESLPLAELIKSEQVWQGNIESNDQVVKIKRSLLEWEIMLKLQMNHLDEAIKAYSQVIEPHLKELGQLDFMENYAKQLYRFPADPDDRDDFSKVQALVTSIDEFKARIADKFINNKDPSTECGKALEEVDRCAKALWGTLRQPGLVNELKRYGQFFGDYATQAGGGEALQVCGPDTRIETDWRSIYQTIEEAYVMLSDTSYAEKIHQLHCEEVFSFLEGLEASGQAVQASDLAPYENTENPLVASILFWLKFAPAVVGNSPGPPSLVAGIINGYGRFSITELDIKNGKALSTQAFNRMLGLMKVFNLGKPVNEAQKQALRLAIENKDLRAGRAELMRFCTGAATGKLATVVGKVFKSGMLLLSCGIFANSVLDDEKSTLKYWLKITETGGNAGLAVSGWLENILIDRKFIMKGSFKVLTRSLGVIAGLAGGIVSALDAYDAYQENDDLAFVLHAAGAIGAILGIAGYLAWVGVLTLSTGVGLFFMIAGTILSIGGAIWLVIRDIYKAGTEVTLEALREKFTEEGTLYNRLYSTETEIVKNYNNLIQAENELDFWELSWRAAVPLCEAGFGVYEEKDDTTLKRTPELDVIETANTIEPMIDADIKDIKEKLYSYRKTLYELRILVEQQTKMEPELPWLPASSTKRFEQIEEKVAEMRKAIKQWREGTIHPNEPPQPIEFSY